MIRQEPPKQEGGPCLCVCVNLLQRCNRICVWTVCAAECHSAIY
nr:MAG TPA: hypothetical protein [Caudoviricetes sp.]